jgi:hypothetical protein
MRQEHTVQSQIARIISITVIMAMVVVVTTTVVRIWMIPI